MNRRGFFGTVLGAVAVARAEAPKAAPASVEPTVQIVKIDHWVNWKCQGCSKWQRTDTALWPTMKSSLVCVDCGHAQTGTDRGHVFTETMPTFGVSIPPSEPLLRRSIRNRLTLKKMIRERLSKPTRVLPLPE